MNISALKINQTKSLAANAIAEAENTATTALVTMVTAATALMSCELCGLSGGPFSPAEAAHLRSIHDRMFHGFSSAA